MTMALDELIVRADIAAANIRARAVTVPSVPDRLSRPRKRRHRLTPIEYRLSQAELIVSGTALGILIAALTFPLAWILFRVVA